MCIPLEARDQFLGKDRHGPYDDREKRKDREPTSDMIGLNMGQAPGSTGLGQMVALFPRTGSQHKAAKVNCEDVVVQEPVEIKSWLMYRLATEV